MAKVISIDTGVKEFDINGAYTARFNPTDETFLHGIEKTVADLEAIQERIKDASGFAVFCELDKEMRAAIDGLLGAGAADAIFENVNCYALSDGLPVWLNLIYALLDEVSEAYESEHGKNDERTKALNEKYGAMLARYRRKKS